ncbi:MAG: secondary thiamine-phosphate synthase enzyme YjbQ [Bacteroidales bacterium]|nr:secondary thiamine-phosphate synthase enzyme YjbQ [Bacteroidales bacterium]
MIKQIEVVLPAYKRGFHLITKHIESMLDSLPETGMLNIFLRHTSAGICINENADPSVRFDFETVFNKLVPENDPDYTHVFEGDDDLPAHIKSSLSSVSINIPIQNHRLALGIWQGIYLGEFRNNGGKRSILCTIYQ